MHVESVRDRHTLSPLARAVRIASTSLSVSGVRDRLVGFETTLGSDSGTGGCSLAMPRFACCHAELSRSRRRWVFGLNPPSSTQPGEWLRHDARFRNEE